MPFTPIPYPLMDLDFTAEYLEIGDTDVFVDKMNRYMSKIDQWTGHFNLAIDSINNNAQEVLDEAAAVTSSLTADNFRGFLADNDPYPVNLKTGDYIIFESNGRAEQYNGDTWEVASRLREDRDGEGTIVEMLDANPWVNFWRDSANGDTYRLIGSDWIRDVQPNEYISNEDVLNRVAQAEAVALGIDQRVTTLESATASSDFEAIIAAAPEYSNDTQAAAGGLDPLMIYVTPDGVVMRLKAGAAEPETYTIDMATITADNQTITVDAA